MLCQFFGLDLGILTQLLPVISRVRRVEQSSLSYLRLKVET